MDPQVQAFLATLTPQQLEELMARQGLPNATMAGAPVLNPNAPPQTDPGGMPPQPALPPAGGGLLGMMEQPGGLADPTSEPPQLSPDMTPASMPAPAPQPAPPPLPPGAAQSATPGAINPMLLEGLAGAGRPMARPEAASAPAPAPRARPLAVSSREAPEKPAGRPRPRAGTPARASFIERMKRGWKTRGQHMQDLAVKRMLEASRRD